MRAASVAGNPKKLRKILKRWGFEEGYVSHSPFVEWHYKGRKLVFPTDRRGSEGRFPKNALQNAASLVGADSIHDFLAGPQAPNKNKEAAASPNKGSTVNTAIRKKVQGVLDTFTSHPLTAQEVTDLIDDSSVGAVDVAVALVELRNDGLAVNDDRKWGKDEHVFERHAQMTADQADTDNGDAAVETDLTVPDGFDDIPFRSRKIVALFAANPDQTLHSTDLAPAFGIDPEGATGNGTDLHKLQCSMVNLCNSGELARVGTGTYKYNSQQEDAAPAADPEPEPDVEWEYDDTLDSIRDQVISLLSSNPDYVFSPMEIATTVQANKSSVCSALERQLTAGTVTRPERGRYQWNTDQPTKADDVDTEPELQFDADDTDDEPVNDNVDMTVKGAAVELDSQPTKADTTMQVEVLKHFDNYALVTVGGELYKLTPAAVTDAVPA